MRRRGAEVLREQGSHYRLALQCTPPEAGRQLFQAAKEAGAQLRGFQTAQRSLEDIFLEAVV
jgi:hypothetical protein